MDFSEQDYDARKAKNAEHKAAPEPDKARPQIMYSVDGGKLFATVAEAVHDRCSPPQTPHRRWCGQPQWPLSVAEHRLKSVYVDELEEALSETAREYVTAWYGSKFSEFTATVKTAIRECAEVLAREYDVSQYEPTYKFILVQRGEYTTMQPPPRTTNVPALVAMLRAALARSPYDVAACSECGRPVVCLPDGQPVCNECAKEGER